MSDVFEERSKRDIFRFDGERPTAINLEHVTMIDIQDKTIRLNFLVNGISVDLESAEKAKEIFEKLVKFWVSHVVE